MSFLNYLHENHAVIETEILYEDYIVEEYYDAEDLFESIKTFKDVPAGLKKVLVKSYKKAGEASSISDLTVQSEGKITTKAALQAALKAALDISATVSGIVVEIDGKGVLGVVSNLNRKFDVYSAEGTIKGDYKDLNVAATLKAIKEILDADIEGGISAALKTSKAIEIKAVHGDKAGDDKRAERRENTKDDRQKRWAGSELTRDERARVINKFAAKHITKHVNNIVKVLPEVLGDTEALLNAAVDPKSSDHKKVRQVSDLLRDLSNSLDAYRWASEESRIRDFDGEIVKYLQRIKKD